MIITSILIVTVVGLLTALSAAQRRIQDPERVAEQELRALRSSSTL
jgi:hypothetical protein